MLTFNTIGICIMVTVFIVEITLVLKHQHEAKLVKDVKANMVLGLLYLLTGLMIKGVAFSFFSLVYYYALFKPALS